VRSHFFEFLDDAGRPRLAHELETGQEYSVALTTSGGLRRYRLHDRVRVAGFERECPLLTFVGKESNVSDRFGEKVSELQVAVALRDLPARFAMVACEGKAYTLFVETPVDDDGLRAAADRLEAVLRQNVHYQYCRKLKQLEAVRAFRIRGRPAERFLAECKSRGQRLGEVKSTLLRRDSGWVEVFDGEFVGNR
jgi:hypothetical protein